MTETFEDIAKEHFSGQEEIIAGIKKRLADSMGMATEEVKFTQLQRAAFNKEGFWLTGNEAKLQHVIIQGATSSGKTLVSEIAILDTLKTLKYHHKDKSIVLVPLRAMVRERWLQLRHDIPTAKDSIYASSSDFQEHDYEIINGNYTVAVIVYEKFFSMLSQANSKLIDECGLVVVDELQMLSNLQRGPKLEIAIQNILRKKDSNPSINTRIMCLTTNDCNVKFIQRWLTVDGREPISISNAQRPTDLEEIVITVNGQWRSRFTPKDGGQVRDVLKPEKPYLEVTQAEGRNRLEERKTTLLIALLKKIYAETPNAKVLVFVGARRKTQKLAERVASADILKHQELTKELKQIENFADDYDDALRNKFLPRRIAFHSAAISTALREFIEKNFSRHKDPIRLVTATETLTIGMNMPVDVIILYDHELPRNNKKEGITGQEYKNYIGRAGRLGQKNNLGGKSFLIAVDENELQKFWGEYVNCNKDEIQSALMNADETFQAPYYLSLMSDDGITLNDLEELWQESFSKSCGGKKINMNTLLEKLRKANLIDTDDEEEEEYWRTDFGCALTPYAITLDACKKIFRYFMSGGYIKKNGQWHLERGKGGLPESVTDKDIDCNRYLLDILYVICSTEHIVKQVGQLKIPSPIDSDAARKLMRKIEAVLKRIVNEEKYECWENSPLKLMAQDEYDWKREVRDKEILMRAILLWYWTQGKEMSEIRTVTKFGSDLVIGGDIARLAETVAYKLEAASRCIGMRQGKSKIENLNPSALYHLSTRINYGVPKELVSVANKHVHALDRKKILEIGRFFEEHRDYYKDPLTMLLFPTPEHSTAIKSMLSEENLQDLRQSADDASTRESLNDLLNDLRSTPPSGMNVEEFCEAIEKLNATGGTKDSLEILPKIFKAYEKNFEGLTLEFPLPDKNFAELKFKATGYPETEFFLMALGKDCSKEKLEPYLYRVSISKVADKKIILLAKNASTLHDVFELGVKSEDVELDKSEDLVMMFETFSALITQSVRSSSGILPLVQMLRDTHGVFERHIHSFNGLLKNYEPSVEHENFGDDIELKIIREKRKSSAGENLFKELRKQRISFCEIPWRKDMVEQYGLNSRDVPLLVFLDRDSLSGSMGLTELKKTLERRRYANVFMIFDSEKALELWDDKPHHFCTSTKNFASDIELKLKSMLEQKPVVGVSYSHQSKEALLFTKFVENIQNKLGEELIFYDDNKNSKFFHGNNSRQIVWERYSQCKFFIVHDDESYDESTFCLEEGKVIKKRMDELGNQHLWLIQTGQRLSEFYTDVRQQGYTSKLTCDTIDALTKDFLKKFRSESN